MLMDCRIWIKILTRAFADDCMSDLGFLIANLAARLFVFVVVGFVVLSADSVPIVMAGDVAAHTHTPDEST